MQNDLRQVIVSVGGKTMSKRFQRGDRQAPQAVSEHSALPASLLPLVHIIEEILVPVRSRKAFREELYCALMESARRQYAQNAVVSSNTSVAPWQQVAQWFFPPQGGGSKRWLWGAAAVGSAASVAGIVAIALHHRQSRAASDA